MGGRTAAKHRPRIGAARVAAFHILQEIARSNSAHSDTLLHGRATERLSPQDRSLATTLVMGVLRWQLALDGLIRDKLHHAARLDEPVATALRLGAFQLLLLDRIPPHAAIHDSVELVKTAGHRFSAGLVNAVLRKIATEKPLPLDAVAAHPSWMVERWRAQLGADAVAAVCAYNQQTPGTAVRLRGGWSMESGMQPGEFLSCAGVLRDDEATTKGPIPMIDPQCTDLRFQDEGSQLIAELASEGRRILDCCAAPGGKAAILAERNPAAEIIACDISRARLERMRQNFTREAATSRIQCLEADATKLHFEAPFDLILCDAPCSGTGTLARNPEIKLRLQEEDLERQQQRQVAILRSAMGCLEHGGRLVYSTCSLEPEENEDVVKRCLDAEPKMRLLPVAERLTALERSGTLHAEGAARLRAHALRGDFLQTVPGVLRCDGFFAAVFTRE